MRRLGLRAGFLAERKFAVRDLRLLVRVQKMYQVSTMGVKFALGAEDQMDVEKKHD